MKRRGRRKGWRKAWATDPDRYVIGMVVGLLDRGLLGSGIDLEHAAMFAIYVHRRDQIKLPPDLLQWSRRLGLSPRLQELVREGYQLQQWGTLRRPNRDEIGSQVDRIRKKMARIVNDPAAMRWLYYMGHLAWGGLLVAPMSASRIIEAAVKEAGETEYFEKVMLPFAKNF
jgi:hypothetical protein